MKHVPRRFRTHYYRDRAESRVRLQRIAATFERLMNPRIWALGDDDD